jgi:hypothetical protein
MKGEILQYFSKRLRIFVVLILKYLLKSLNQYYVKTALIIIKYIPKNIYISNDTLTKIDGLGAQIQRLISSYALSSYCRIKFFQSDITSVTVHPLDPYQNLRSQNLFVKKVNKSLKIVGNNKKSQKIAFNEFKYVQLSATNLLVQSVKSNFRNEPTLLKVVESYKICDFKPELYTNLPRFKFIKLKKTKSKRNTIVIHYRRGVGGMAIYPGQSTPREMPIEYFVKIVTGLYQESKYLDYEIILLTDSPLKKTTYKPPKNQKTMWAGFPNYNGRVMEIAKLDLPLIREKIPKVKIKSGGDPLEAIKLMANAEVLILSKSSLSYVSALMNTSGKIFFPKDFWHTPLKNWNIISTN